MLSVNRLSVGGVWPCPYAGPLLPASLRGRPRRRYMVWRNERSPGWPGRMGFGRGKVVGTHPCSPRTASPSPARAEPFPGKRPSRRRLRAMSVPSSAVHRGLAACAHRVLPTHRGAPVHCFNASTTGKCTHSSWQPTDDSPLAPTSSLFSPAHREIA